MNVGSEINNMNSNINRSIYSNNESIRNIEPRRDIGQREVEQQGFLSRIVNFFFRSFRNN